MAEKTDGAFSRKCVFLTSGMVTNEQTATVLAVRIENEPELENGNFYGVRGFALKS